MMLRRTTVLTLGLAMLMVGAAVPAMAATEAEEPPALDWPFEGIFGTFDRASLQRGFLVYKDVCASCHTVEHLYYRHLSGIGFNEDEIKALAAEIEVTDGPDEFGDLFQRPGRPSDPLVHPFDNEQQARAANGGALPPDLTLITKARPGANYVHAVLTGYEDAPSDFELGEGQNYNPFFKGRAIAMPPPLFDDMVEFADGTPATVDQMSRDVSAFLAWAAEPELEERKETGFVVVIFLIILTGLLYATKRQIWSNVH